MDRTIRPPPLARVRSRRDTGTPDPSDDPTTDTRLGLRPQNWVEMVQFPLLLSHLRHRQRRTSLADLENFYHQIWSSEQSPWAAVRPRARTPTAAPMINSNIAPPEEPPVQSEGTRHIPAEKHSQRKKKLLSLLKPIGSDQDIESSWVFLCWGKKTQCTIVAVRIPNATPEVGAWQLINKAWYSSRGKWRRYFPMLDVQKIEVVEVSIAGRQRSKFRNTKEGPHFVGICTPTYPENDQQRHERTIARHNAECEYNSSTRCIEHSIFYQFEHVLDSAEEELCTEWPYKRAQDELARIRQLPFLTLAFKDPKLAAANDLLQENKLKLRHWQVEDTRERLNSLTRSRAILAKLSQPKLAGQKRQTLREVEFEALWLDDTLDSYHASLPLAGAVLAFSVLVARLAFGDWAIAWTAGGTVMTAFGAMVAYDKLY